MLSETKPYGRLETGSLNEGPPFVESLGACGSGLRELVEQPRENLFASLDSPVLTKNGGGRAQSVGVVEVDVEQGQESVVQESELEALLVRKGRAVDGRGIALRGEEAPGQLGLPLMP